MRFFSVLHLWPGSLRACIPDLNAFSWMFALFLTLLLFANVLHLILPFVLCCFIFFNASKRQIGVAVFVIAKITVFCGVFLDVSCAIRCWCICFGIQFLAFRVQYCGRLIFWSAFVNLLIIFSGQIPQWYKFCSTLICLGVTCSCFTIFPCHILLLFVLRAFTICNFGYINFFVELLKNSLIVLICFELAFFW